MAPSVHRRQRRDRPGQADGRSLHHRRPRAGDRQDPTLRGAIRDDAPDLPALLPGDAARPHHARARVAVTRGHAGDLSETFYLASTYDTRWGPRAEGGSFQET